MQAIVVGSPATLAPRQPRPDDPRLPRLVVLRDRWRAERAVYLDLKKREQGALAERDSAHDRLREVAEEIPALRNAPRPNLADLGTRVDLGALGRVVNDDRGVAVAERQLADARRRVTDAEAECARLRDLAAAQGDRVQRSGRLVSRCETYVAGGQE